MHFTTTLEVPGKHCGFSCQSVIVGKVSTDLIRLILQPEVNESVFRMKWFESITEAHIWTALGCFPSISQAKKAGWDKPLKPGFSELGLKKQKKVIHILCSRRKWWEFWRD